jgi:mannose-6-phosphate isomerase-like protein (cupin superfamily)
VSSSDSGRAARVPIDSATARTPPLPAMDNTAFRMRQARPPFSLQGVHVHLKDLGMASLMEVGPDFWATLAQRPESQAGRLVGSYRFERDLPHWEMHPAGDELLVALDGSFELILQSEPRDQVIPLEKGQAYLVPFGAWHRIRVLAPGEILFVTPQKGSQSRPV